MTQSMRPWTLETLGLGSVLDLVKRGAPPVTTGELVDRIFGAAEQRGALVVSGANGIVGAGKTMQLGSRLHPFGVPVVALDFPGVPDGIGRQPPGQHPGIVRKMPRGIDLGVLHPIQRQLDLAAVEGLVQTNTGVLPDPVLCQHLLLCQGIR